MGKLVGGLFDVLGGLLGGGGKKPTMPGPDPELERLRAEARAAEEKKAADARIAAEQDATARRNRMSGRMSLITGNYLGYARPDDLKGQ